MTFTKDDRFCGNLCLVTPALQLSALNYFTPVPIMSADDNRSSKPADGIPKPFVLPFVAGLAATILMCGLMIYSQRDRYDATVYSWCAILIVVAFPIAIPLAIWQQKLKERAHRKAAFPWPEPPANPLFGTPLPIPYLHLEGTFIWTSGAFDQLASGWRRYTPAGKRYCRSIIALTSLGLAGITMSAIFLWQREWSAIALIVASGLLLLFAYDSRIRAPREVRSLARMRWAVLPEGFILGTEENQKVIKWQAIRAVVQTPAGFIFWSQNLFELCLPAKAFATSDELHSFSAIAQSKVRDFVRIDRS